MAKKAGRNASFLVASDLHIAERAWRHRDVAGDAYWSLKQIARIAEEDELVEAVVLAGDVFDTTNPQPKDVLAFRQFASSLKRVGIELYYIQGQHEMSAEVNWCSAISDHAVPLHHSLLRVAGHMVAGLDYTPADRLQVELESLKDAEFLITHQSWKGLFNADTATSPLSTELVGKSFDMGNVCDGEVDWLSRWELTITGDWHVPVFSRLNGHNVLSPGSTCRQSINECVPKFVWRVDWPGKAVPIPLEVRNHIESKVLNKEEDLDLFLHNAVKQDKSLTQETPLMPFGVVRPTVRVNYIDQIPRLKERVVDRLGDPDRIWFKACAPTNYTDAAVKVTSLSRDSSALVSVFESTVTDKDLLRELTALTKSRNLAKDWETIRSKHLEARKDSR